MAIQQKLDNSKVETDSKKETGNSQYPFYIHDQYVKDLSFENPNYLIKYSETNVKPEISVNVGTSVSKLNEDTYEVMIKVDVNSTVEKKQIFLIDLSYCALVSVDKKQSAEVLEPALLVHTPFLMFPFVRELIANITKNGGYPPLLLDPIDFASLYVQKKKEANEVSETQNNEKPTIH